MICTKHMYNVAYAKCVLNIAFIIRMLNAAFTQHDHLTYYIQVNGALRDINNLKGAICHSHDKK
jgi:hypothetical protein